MEAAWHENTETNDNMAVAAAATPGPWLGSTDPPCHIFMCLFMFIRFTKLACKHHKLITPLLRFLKILL